MVRVCSKLSRAFTDVRLLKSREEKDISPKQNCGAEVFRCVNYSILIKRSNICQQAYCFLHYIRKLNTDCISTMVSFKSVIVLMVLKIECLKIKNIGDKYFLIIIQKILDNLQDCLSEEITKILLKIFMRFVRNCLEKTFFNKLLGDAQISKEIATSSKI